ncbi:MAG: hypothetical protein KC619_31895 [Myxococcales bacterium]|nr:hypothetical protein [Myxococcales bacterium]
MALLLSALSSGLETAAASPPETVADAAGAWADAMQAYAAGVTPASTTVAAAAATLETALTAAFANRPDAASAMELAFTAFATTVGGGMAGYTPTPPPGPVGFAARFAAASPATHAAAAAAMAGIIDTWMRTGSATPSGGGAPVAWS